MKRIVIAAAMLLAGCHSADDSAPRRTTSPSPSRATSTLVYYLVDQPNGLRIAREPHAVHKAAAKDAVEAMIAGPDDPLVAGLQLLAEIGRAHV